MNRLIILLTGMLCILLGSCSSDDDGPKVPYKLNYEHPSEEVLASSYGKIWQPVKILTVDDNNLVVEEKKITDSQEASEYIFLNGKLLEIFDSYGYTSTMSGNKSGNKDPEYWTYSIKPYRYLSESGVLMMAYPNYEYNWQLFQILKLNETEMIISYGLKTVLYKPHKIQDIEKYFEYHGMEYDPEKFESAFAES